MKMRSIIGISIFLLLGTGPALAEDPPAETCKRPELREQVNVSAEQLNYVSESARSYIDCMKPVIEAKRKDAQETLDAGQAKARATNAAIEEVNAFIAAFAAYQQKHKGDQ